ncbi:hypothetical protein Mal52_07270 [Symmachiella dynata]|uniref:Uncharacterized protein n=1 Tax=Symmachiella dynata TaxID=2527995 RepID=A0A517ZIH6_9PLAN|nr:hypothetical protein Mal52_07270 [Symmachiella dynata]
MTFCWQRMRVLFGGSLTHNCLHSYLRAEVCPDNMIPVLILVVTKKVGDEMLRRDGSQRFNCRVDVLCR